jgi:hypothetical protein
VMRMVSLLLNTGPARYPISRCSGRLAARVKPGRGSG